MEMGENGTWNISIKEDLKGKFYTFNVKVNGKWLGDTQNYGKSRRVNGKQTLCDLRSTESGMGERCASSFEKNYADITRFMRCIIAFLFGFCFRNSKKKASSWLLTEQGTTSSSGEDRY